VAALTPKQRTEAFMQSIINRKQSFASLLPKGVNPDWFMAEVRVAVARSPNLATCDQVSVFDAITTCAQLGLSPSGRLGSAYLIPFKEKCTLVVGYKGYLDLAYRSGEVMGMQAQVVHEADEFEWEEGLEPKLRHIRSADENPGKMTHAYAVATMKNGHKAFVVMLAREVLRIKARAPGAKKAGGPWDTDEAEMWKKTSVRRLLKMLPLSPQKAQGLFKAQEVEDAVFEEMDLLAREEEAEGQKTSGMDSLQKTLDAGAKPETLEFSSERERVLAEAKAEAERGPR
jgi:recombination protein RecT